MWYLIYWTTTSLDGGRALPSNWQMIWHVVRSVVIWLVVQSVVIWLVVRSVVIWHVVQSVVIWHVVRSVTLFFCLLSYVESAAWHSRQIPRLVSVFCGGHVLHQHPVTFLLPSLASGEEQDHYRYLHSMHLPINCLAAQATLSTDNTCDPSKSLKRGYITVWQSTVLLYD